MCDYDFLLLGVVFVAQCYDFLLLGVVFVAQCCCAGVGHLWLMLNARAPLSEDEEYSANDSTMVELLKQGF